MSDLTTTLGSDGLALLKRRNLLKALVEQEVVAEAVGDVAVTAAEQEEAMARICGTQSREDCLARVHDDMGWSPEDLEWQALLPVRIQKYCAERFSAKAEARFLERKPQLDQVVYSLLRVKDSALAREIYLRIGDGEASFADLAARYSQGPERASRGIVGPKPLAAAHPELAARLRSAQTGQLLEPFRILEWWMVVRVESHQPASYTASMATQMASELFAIWVQQQVKDRIAQLIHAEMGDSPTLRPAA